MTDRHGDGDYRMDGEQIIREAYERVDERSDGRIERAVELVVDLED